MKIDFARSAKQPFSGNWMFNILIVAGITLAGMFAGAFGRGGDVAGFVGSIVALAVSIATYGFYARVMANTVDSRNATSLPDFTDNTPELLWRGLTVTAGMSIWMLVLGLVSAAIGIPFLAAAMNPLATVGLPIISIAIFAAFALVLVPFLALMSVHLAVTNNFMSIIDVVPVFQRMIANPLSTVLAVGATGVLFTVAKFAILIPVIGIFGYAIATVVAGVMVASIWAQVYRG